MSNRRRMLKLIFIKRILVENMINAIEFRNNIDKTYLNRFGGTLIYLANIKHINIFLGANNSGKSRFMRNIANSKDAVLLTDDKNEAEKNGIKNVRDRLDRIVKILREIEYSSEPVFNTDEMSATELFVFYKAYFESIKLAERNFAYPHSNINKEAVNALDSLYRVISSTPSGRQNNLLNTGVRFYIPVLRGIESFNNYFDIRNNQVLGSIQMNDDQRRALEAYKANAGRIYKNKISSVYGMDEKIVFTGENLYEEIRDKLLGEEDERAFIRDFESFISDNFYNGEGFTISPLIAKGYLNVKIGQSPERPLHNLGDGIKQLICILYKVFEYKGQESFIFIEEPEICLHPGYQRKLIDILQREEFSKQYLFITTHSNHFVDSCFNYDNVSIYKFINAGAKNSSFQVINSSPRDIELLNLLGVNNSSVFMANTTIWVEGISDKIYLSKYLQVYMEGVGDKIYQEGVDYAFVEYGGNNVVHWTFTDDNDIALIKASGITNRAYMIVDNDNDSKKKRKEKLRSVFGEFFYELKVREIENTIKKEVLEKTLFKEAPVYKKGKQEVKDRFDTKKACIWEYIDNHYSLERKYWDASRKRPRIGKADFAKKICSNIRTIEDLSKNARALCENLYDFIKSTHESIGR